MATAAVAVMSLLVLGQSATLAVAPDGGPEFTLDPPEGLAGTVVEVRGSWLDGAGDDEFIGSVRYESNERLIGSVVLDPDGEIRGDATIPLDTAAGAVGLELCWPDPDGLSCTSAVRFTVLPPTLDATPSVVAPGEQLVVTGEGWCCPGAPVIVTDTATEQRWGEGAVGETGQLSATAAVPDDAVEGQVELAACTRQVCQVVPVSVEGPVDQTTAPSSTPGDVTTPTTPSTSIAPSTTAPSSTPGDVTTPTTPSTSIAPSTTATTATTPSTVAVTDTVETVETSGATLAPSSRTPSMIAGTVLVGGAGVALGGLAWLRRSSRPVRRVTGGRLVVQPDCGRQEVRGRDGPVVVVSASLELDPGTTTLQIRRRS